MLFLLRLKVFRRVFCNCFATHDLYETQYKTHIETNFFKVAAQRSLRRKALRNCWKTVTERAIVFGPVGGRKIIDFRVDFGARNGSKIDENGGSKTYRNQSAFRKCFRRFWSRFGVPRPSQKSWKIIKSRTCELLKAKTWTWKAPGKQFWRFGRDPGAILDDLKSCFEERSLQPLLRNSTSKNILWWLGRRGADQ